MSRIEFEPKPLKTNIDTKSGIAQASREKVYSREDAERGLLIIQTQTYCYIQDMAAANDRQNSMLWRGYAYPPPKDNHNRIIAELLRATGKRKPLKPKLSLREILHSG